MQTLNLDQGLPQGRRLPPRGKGEGEGRGLSMSHPTNTICLTVLFKVRPNVLYALFFTRRAKCHCPKGLCLCLCQMPLLPQRSRAPHPMCACHPPCASTPPHGVLGYYMCLFAGWWDRLILRSGILPPPIGAGRRGVGSGSGPTTEGHKK